MTTVLEPHETQDHDEPVASGFLVDEDAATYEAQSDRFLTSRQLAEFRRNPVLFQKRQTGVVHEDDRRALSESERAARTLILSGRAAYERVYRTNQAVRNGRRILRRTWPFRSRSQPIGKILLTVDEAGVAETMFKAVQAHGHASRLLSKGIVGGVVRASYRGVPCQARLDGFDPVRGLVELKCCHNLDWFEIDARTYEYAHELAFHRALVACVHGDVVPACLVGVETREPFRCGVWHLSSRLLDSVAQDNVKAIDRLKRCRARNHWPTGYEEIRVGDWM